jgi:parallel beta-helix repeat protein
MTEATARLTIGPRRQVLRTFWRDIRFRDALLISLIPLLAIVLIVGASWNDYLRSREFDDWWSRPQTMRSAFSARARGIAALPRSLRLRDEFPPEKRDAGVIRLEVAANAWDSLEVEAPGTWAPWISGNLRYGSTVTPIRLRKRGDNSIHWLTDKRALTIRTPRDDFYKRFRSFGLSGKDVLMSFLANRLSGEFGLLAPSTEVVPVYLNNRFYGTYRFIEVVDESFLRPFDRMPGNIFRGDAAERESYFKGAPRGLFDNPYLWDRASANDRPTSAGTGQLQLLLGGIASRTFAEHERMMNRLDRGEFGRLFAFLLLVGDPYHMDGLHNQMLYEDPSTQKMHPIPWDIRILDLTNPEKPVSPLFQAVLRDPFVLDSTMREIARRLEGDAFLKLADSLVRGTEARYADELEYDRLRKGLIPDVNSSDGAMSLLRANAGALRKRLAADTIAFAATPGAAATTLDFETRGWVGADLAGFTLDRPATGATLRLDRNRNGVLDAADPVVALSVTGAELKLASPVALYPGWKAAARIMTPGSMPYRMFLSGVPAGAHVTPVLANRATGKANVVVALAAGSVIREGSAWHPWAFAAPTASVHRLSGVVRLDETMRIPEGDTLIIAPGTQLLLAKDVSIVSRGRVLANGTAASPIRVLPQVQNVPWGTFSIQGHGADSSIFTYVEFAQGGGALVDRIEYIGMVNVHRADGVVIDHNIFRDNLRSDDTFHGMHSRVYVRNSQFIRANSDALDLDLATGEITDNTFDASGGDAIDLMTSTPLVRGNRITGSGDKGISIGEASRPFVFNNIIDSCAIGIEAKDRSDPIILNNTVTNSGIGFRERRKNWRYGGGSWSTVVRTLFADNPDRWRRDVYSRVTLSSVVGLDTAKVAVMSDSSDVSWIYRLNGIEPPASHAPGALASWSPAPHITALDQQTFTDDFRSVSDQWTPSDGMKRLEKRRDALIMEVERQAGAATRPVRWQLPKGGTLVLEVSARDLARAIVRVHGSTGTVTREFWAGSELATARFAAIPLPAGTYDSLAIELAPIPGLTQVDPATQLTVLRGGRLDLRGFRLFSPFASR